MLTSGARIATAERASSVSRAASSLNWLHAGQVVRCASTALDSYRALFAVEPSRDGLSTLYAVHVTVVLR